MKVKVGDKIYDGEQEPVMVILNDMEKDQIKNMSPKTHKFCVYPDTEEWNKNEYHKIKKWMVTE